MPVDTAITTRTAEELLAAFEARELSPVEAARAALERIEATDASVNAFCLVDPDRALEAAAASERRYVDGSPVGLLDGVPVAVKDVFLTRGWPTRKGSVAIAAEGPWEDDAPPVARLREHGAVLLGKTTTPELGWKGVTDSPLTGVTRNPWDPRRTPGGSSGGSAAAIALGMAPLATGTDGGGSIRIPAGFTGLVGHKPTFGRVPHFPPSPYGTLAHAGPMAWTVADAARMLDVLAGPDSRDWALPAASGSFREALSGGVEGLSVAFSPTLGYVEVDPAVAEPVARAAAALEELGARVEQVDPGFEDPVEAFQVAWYAGASKALEAFDPHARQRMDPALQEIAEVGAGYSASDLLGALAARDALGVDLARFHDTYDLLVTPTLPIPAFEAGREVPEGWQQRRWMSWTQFSYPFNLTQQPAASVPCGFTADGLPVGLQIVGAKHADALVLRAAHAYQTAHPLTDRRPAS